MGVGEHLGHFNQLKLKATAHLFIRTEPSLVASVLSKRSPRLHVEFGKQMSEFSELMTVQTSNELLIAVFSMLSN